MNHWNGYKSSRLLSLLYSKLKQDCKGKENSICRSDLLIFCQAFIKDVTDREMRQAYSLLPICTWEKGVFWPVNESELDEFHDYLVKKAKPLFIRWRRVAQAHRELLSGRFNEQMKFF